MASEVDIVNLALAHLGDNATVASIDPPEGSAEAEHAARFYPIARDVLLESHGWRFATRRTVLAQLNLPSWNWQYVYAAPNNSLKLLSVLPVSAANDAQTQEYEAASSDAGDAIVYTNQEVASLRYITRVADTTKYPPLFIDALAWLVGSYLAGPVVKGDAGVAMAKSCYANFRASFSQAIESDANQRKITPKHDPEWMSGR